LGGFVPTWWDLDQGAYLADIVGAEWVEPRGIEPLTSALPARVAIVHGSSWRCAIGKTHPHR
jgi:hypothetical protein